MNSGPISRRLSSETKLRCTRLYPHYVTRWLESQGFRSIQYERTYGHKTFDLSWKGEGGQVEAAEICLTGSPQRTAEQLLAGLENKGLVRLLAVFENRKLLDETRQALETTDQRGLAAGRINYRLIGEIIEAGMAKED